MSCKAVLMSPDVTTIIKCAKNDVDEFNQRMAETTKDISWHYQQLAEAGPTNIDEWIKIYEELHFNPFIDMKVVFL